MNKKKIFFITSKRVVPALSLKKQKINLLKSFVKNKIFFNFCICLFFMDIFVPTSVTAILPSGEEDKIISQTSQSFSQKKPLTNVRKTLFDFWNPKSSSSSSVSIVDDSRESIAKTSPSISDDKRVKRNSPESGTKSPDAQKKQKTNNVSKSSDQNILHSQKDTLCESEEEDDEVDSFSTNGDCSEQEADEESLSLSPRSSPETLPPISSSSISKQGSGKSALNKIHTTRSPSSSLIKATPTPGRTIRANLNVYLLKSADEALETLEGLAKAFQDPPWHSFPWQFINASKYPLIGAREAQPDNLALNYFIDGQIYTDIPGATETVYVFQETGLRQTEWIKTLHSQTKKYRSLEQTRNSLSELDRYKEPKGAVVFVKKNIEGQDIFFALTFGTSGRFLLNLDECDTSFGKHYAYNVLANNPNHRPHSFTEINLDEKKLQREQAKAHGKVVVERGVRAFIPKAMTVSDGKQPVCSFLGAHICVRDEFDFGTIGEKCQQWLKTSQEKGYKSKYLHIDYFEPIEQKEEVKKAFLKSFEHFYIEPPFEIEGGRGAQAIYELELSTRNKTKTAWRPYGGLKKQYTDFTELADDLQKFIKSSSSHDNTFKLLKDLKVIPKDDNGNVLSIWKGHQLISSMIELEGNTYWIEGGELFRVSKNFIELVNKRVDKLFLPHGALPSSSLSQLSPFKDGDIQNRKASVVSSEAAYNQRMASENPEHFFLLDCQNIRVAEDPHSQSKVEPCDLLSREGDLIHVKKWSASSSSISYLVSQSLNSAKLLVENDKFLEDVIEKLPKTPHFENLKEKLILRNMRVVIAFIHNKDGTSPSRLPINAKMDLYRGLLEIEKMDFKSAIICIKDDSTRNGSSSSQSSSSQSGASSTQESFSSLSSFSTLQEESQ
ncbi:MAG: TIGR04141 family sporadically distributed protein [Alphaproteobacteria bacterium]|nr:TIGR04141 family sporadically distributed protein [Alphaproteobacteria bacterium]